MPHVHRRTLLSLDVPPGEARAAAQRALGLTSRPDGALGGPLPHAERLGATLRVTVRAGPDRTTVELESETDLRVPYFQWFFRPVLRSALRRRVDHAAAAVQATVNGADPPPPPKPPLLLPPVPFDDRQTRLLATVSALGALAAFGAALFGQNADSVAHSFHASDAALGWSLAATRVGVLIALVVTALADRRGRRRLLAVSFAGLCMANAATALAPNLIVFTATQLFTRAFVQATLVVAGIAVIEDAPDGARAFAATMFGLASGAGFALTVILLPLADLGPEAWRISFAVSGLSVLLLPPLLRSLPETRRYTALAARTAARGRVSEVIDRSYGPRLALLGCLAFLTNVFSAPSAQFTNRFLSHERGFSNSEVSLLRVVTNGVPGLFGFVIGGRVAETRGRRPVAVLALAFGTVLQMVFFLSSGVVLWVASAAAIVGASAAGLALGTLDAELFPTEVRGTSNGLLLLCGVIGSATGLILAGTLADELGGLGRTIALCGLAPLVAAIFLAPRLPESAHRRLDDVSPPEV
jgi:MFS family permease